LVLVLVVNFYDVFVILSVCLSVLQSHVSRVSFIYLSCSVNKHVYRA